MASELSLRDTDPIAQHPGYTEHGVLLLVTGTMWVIFWIRQSSSTNEVVNQFFSIRRFFFFKTLGIISARQA